MGRSSRGSRIVSFCSPRCSARRFFTPRWLLFTDSAPIELEDADAGGRPFSRGSLLVLCLLSLSLLPLSFRR